MFAQFYQCRDNSVTTGLRETAMNKQFASYEQARMGWEAAMVIAAILALGLWAEMKKIQVSRMVGLGLMYGIPALILFVYIFYVNNVEADKVVNGAVG